MSDPLEPTSHGRRLADRYRLDRLIGHGGMAAVYAGYDEALDRPVAIKTTLGAFRQDPAFVERVRREARAAAALNHPNIVSVHDIGSDDGLPFIVMELVGGQSLDRLVAAGRLPRERALEICTDVCAALAYAHQAGVVHCDIKPGNILIADDGTVKVTDFGIARAAGLDTITLTAVLGTAAYLSPEQASGRRVDPRSDLYSLGVVLYELVTGRPPFTGGSPVQVALRHVADTPRRPSVVAPDVDADLEAVVLKALAKDPADRYASADALRHDLLAVRDGVPVGVDHAAALAAAGGLAAAETTRVATGPANTLVLPADTVETAAVPPSGEMAAAALPPPAPQVVEEPSAAAPPAGRRRRRRWLPYLAVGLLGVLALLAVGVLSGERPATVPTLRGLTVVQARAQLKARGLALERVDQQPDPNLPRGAVVAQSPRPGQQVPPGTGVVIAVSSGPPPAPSPPSDRADGDGEEDAEEEQDRDDKEKEDGEDKGSKGKGKGRD